MSGRGNKRKGGHGGGRGGKKGRCSQDSGPAPRDQSGQAMAFGTRGVLITCEQSKEDRSANDAAALFEEHYNKLKAASSTATAAAAAAGGSAEGVKDIGALIAAEVAGIKDQSGKMFKTHHTGVKGCVYVTFPNEPESPTPQEVVLSICKETRETKTVPSRTIMRLIPITHTFSASLDAIKEHAPKVLADSFPADGPGIEYSVDFEHRSSENFDRMTVINSFVDLINAPHKVNLTSPAKTVLVQVMRNSCGASVVDHYREYLRYNLRMLAEPEQDEATKAEKAEKEAKAKEVRVAKKAADDAKKAAAAAAAAPGDAAATESAPAVAPPASAEGTAPVTEDTGAPVAEGAAPAAAVAESETVAAEIALAVTATQ